MVPVSIKSIHSTHTESTLNLRESQVYRVTEMLFVLWVILRLGR